jgi:hypothetical protein
MIQKHLERFLLDDLQHGEVTSHPEGTYACFNNSVSLHDLRGKKAGVFEDGANNRAVVSCNVAKLEKIETSALFGCS